MDECDFRGKNQDYNIPARSGPGSFVLEAVEEVCHPET